MIIKYFLMKFSLCVCVLNLFLKKKTKNSSSSHEPIADWRTAARVPFNSIISTLTKNTVLIRLKKLKKRQSYTWPYGRRSIDC